MDTKTNAVSDKELEQVTGGMSAEDDAVLYGTVMGHLFNAFQEVQKQHWFWYPFLSPFIVL